MRKMGKYCKAYPVQRLREFEGWSEKPVKAENQQGEGEQTKTLTDEDYLYLQENYTVTDGIFIDENVVFDNVTPEWEEFCKNTLEFEVPAFAAAKAAGAEG